MPRLDRWGAVVRAVLFAVIVLVPRFGCCMLYDKVTQRKNYVLSIVI